MSEFLEPSELLLDASWEAVSKFRSAVGWIEGPVEWESSNGLTQYYAVPVMLKGEEVPYGHIKDMPAHEVEEKLKLWFLDKSTIDYESGEFVVERFGIKYGAVRVWSARCSLGILRETDPHSFYHNSLKDDLNRNRGQALPANERDLANIMNAIHDLEPVINQGLEDYQESRRNMTSEDWRNIRALKHAPYFDNEVDKTSAPKWWGVTVASMGSFLVKASSPIEACLNVEDVLECYGERMAGPVRPHADEIQEVLEEQYKGRKVIEMIPYSTVEWPSDPDNLTEAQIAAFDALVLPDKD